MMEKVRAHIGCLHKLAECVSMLDMLASFAHACTLSNYGMALFTFIEYFKSLLSRSQLVASQLNIFY